MKKNSFIVSDETKNCFGIVIKTDGINIEPFIKNPVMLYMHERKTVVGRWENLRKDGPKLIADAVFDDTTELGKRVKAQVEKGFLRSASIGIEIIDEQEINGVRTVTKSILSEISIVDIPANRNALKLCSLGGSQYIKLEVPRRIKNLHNDLIALLQLDKKATDEKIINTIQELLNLPDRATADVENAISEGLISGEDRYNFITMARLSPSVFSRYLDGEKRKTEKSITQMVDKAFTDGKIKNIRQREIYRKIGLKMGVDILSELLDSVSVIKPSDILKLTKDTTLKHEEENIPSDPYKKLTYYRKSNPGYLREHPEVFEKLLESLKQN